MNFREKDIKDKSFSRVWENVWCGSFKWELFKELQLKAQRIKKVFNVELFDLLRMKAPSVKIKWKENVFVEKPFISETWENSSKKSFKPLMSWFRKEKHLHVFALKLVKNFLPHHVVFKNNSVWSCLSCDNIISSFQSKLHLSQLWKAFCSSFSSCDFDNVLIIFYKRISSYQQTVQISHFLFKRLDITHNH